VSDTERLDWSPYDTPSDLLIGMLTGRVPSDPERAGDAAIAVIAASMHHLGGMDSEEAVDWAIAQVERGARAVLETNAEGETILAFEFKNANGEYEKKEG
jgi:hypothetical protein